MQPQFQPQAPLLTLDQRRVIDFLIDEAERRPAVEITFQKGKGFKKCIGKYLHPDGQLRPKVFWLGQHRLLAQRCATLLTTCCDLLREQGESHWTEESLSLATGLLTAIRAYHAGATSAMGDYLRREGQTIPTDRAAAAPLAPTVPAPAKNAPPDLHAAMDRWADHLDRRRDQGDVSDDYAARARSSIRNLKMAMADKPLTNVAMTDLDGARLWYQAAMAVPKGKKGHKAWDTAKTECGHAVAMFRWFVEQGWWTEPPKWEKKLRPARTAQADDEREDCDDAPVRYSLREVGKLLHAANDNQKLWLYCGLNFAWGQKEIATCRKRHWHLSPKGVTVKRTRHKRVRNAKGVYAEWRVWPETWALAEARMAQTTEDESINPKCLAFLTEENLPLVRREKSKCDAITQSFKRLCISAGVENRGFYALRRTAIDLVDDIAGSSIAGLMASHRPRTMTNKHYASRKWRKLRRALRIVRKRVLAAVPQEAPVATRPATPASEIGPSSKAA